MPPTRHKVSPERLEELRCLYKEEFGKEITLAEATAMAHRLLALYTLLQRPLPVVLALPPPSQPSPDQNAAGASQSPRGSS